ncbi:MAG: glycosyltransferase [Acidobacteriota bacterium]
MIARLLFALAAPSVLDSVIRVLLFCFSSRDHGHDDFEPVDRWLVVIPARDEGENLDTTLRSLPPDAGQRVRVVVLLDGPDAVGERVAGRYPVIIRQKLPGGPTKASALRWLAENDRQLISDSDAVLLLDVGSTLSEHFFDRILWPAGADGVQTYLRGRGTGVGRAAARSEQFAQVVEDRGRERLGWNIRLRGTGTALRPDRFLKTVAALSTQVEDLEASLLLSADGARLKMAAGDVWVADEKPGDVSRASSQRARWLAGKLELAVRHIPSMYRLIVRAPLEGVAFVAEMFGRPLVLSVMFRLVVAAVVVMKAPRSGYEGRILAAILLASASVDIGLQIVRSGFGGALELGGSWLRALLLTPRALLSWMRARRP